MEILFVFVLVYAGKHAWDQAWDAWRKSRSAYMGRADKRYPDMPKSRRAGHALRHDLGYGLSQAGHGFPQARHGFAAGWHQGRQAHAQVRAERERAKAEHLETRARLIPDLREYRRRQKAALELIRRGEPWATGAGGEDISAPSERFCPECDWAIPGTGPCPVCGEPSPEAAEEGVEGNDGRTYSYGRADLRHHFPAADLDDAVARARQQSQFGVPHQVHEYPPGGGPGRLIATYGSSVPLSADYLDEADALRDGLDAEDCESCGQGRDAHTIKPDPLGHAHAYCDADLCDLCGEPLPSGYAGIAHEDCIDAHEDDAPSTEGDTVPTGTASGDTTYTQQLNELTEIRQDAEHEVNSVRVKRMMNRLDVLTGLGLDSASLSEAAAIDDALQAQQKAAQQTLDAADAAIHGLKQRHGGIQEAVSSSPVDKPAQPEFYQD